jgi:hypothetical protein
VGDAVRIDFSAWEEHAGWWDAEADQARQRLSVDDATLAQARTAFGKIGSSTVGAALADTLQERHAAGQRLGDYAQGVAGHIRRNLDDYRSAEHDNTQRLRDVAPAAAATRPAAGPTLAAGAPAAVRAVPASDGPHEHEPLPPIDTGGIHHITDIPGMIDDGEGGAFWIPGNGIVF